MRLIEWGWRSSLQLMPIELKKAEPFGCRNDEKREQMNENSRFWMPMNKTVPWFPLYGGLREEDPYRQTDRRKQEAKIKRRKAKVIEERWDNERAKDIRLENWTKTSFLHNLAVEKKREMSPRWQRKGHNCKKEAISLRRVHQSLRSESWNTAEAERDRRSSKQTKQEERIMSNANHWVYNQWA